MKQFSFLLLFTSLSLFSCSPGCKESKYSLNYIPIENNDDDSYNLWGADSNIRTDKFKSSPTPVINGFFTIDDEKTTTLCKIEGLKYNKVVSIPNLEEVGVMNDGLIPVCQDNGYIQVLNEDGDEVYTLHNRSWGDIQACYSYSCGRMRIRMANGYYAYVDTQGNRLFDKFYSWCTDFTLGFAVVCVEDDTYELINVEGESLFSFDSDDYEKISFSPQYKYLATVDKDDRIIIYNFEGRQIGIYPSKVEEVVDFCKDYFVFKSDDSYGLMSYSGTELIRAKYDELVPNGRYFLAIHEDYDEEVRLIDSKDNILKTLDGEEIYCFRRIGYDFPNIILRSDDEIYLVDDSGSIIGEGPINYDFDEEDIEYASYVHNLYFPIDDVLELLLDLCGKGSSLPNSQNAFFAKDGLHCNPTNIKFLRNQDDLSKYRHSYSATDTLSIAINHCVEFGVRFDEPIVTKNSLSTSAWLKSMWIQVSNTFSFQNIQCFNALKKSLLELGCDELFSNNNGILLLSCDGQYLITICYFNKNYHNFFIELYSMNEYNRERCIKKLSAS